MKRLSSDLEFEEAASVRDEIKRLQILELQMRDGEVTKKSQDVTDGVSEGKN
jgi:excinuclease ABC subunit B